MVDNEHARFTPQIGWHLDRLRHSDPKVARMMTRNGNGARSKQYAALIEKGIDPMRTSRTAKDAPYRWSAWVDEALRERIRRADTDKEGNTALLERMLDALERPAPTVASAPAVANAAMSNEAASVLKDMQRKLKLPNTLAAVKRLVEDHDLARQRGEQVRNLEGATSLATARADALRRERDDLLVRLQETERERDLSIDAAHAAEKVPLLTRIVRSLPVANGTADEIVFAMIDAIAGATAVADPSGALRVTLPPEAPAALFLLWVRAVRALGLAAERDESVA